MSATSDEQIPSVASGHVTAEQFDASVNPLDMVGDGPGGA